MTLRIVTDRVVLILHLKRDGIEIAAKEIIPLRHFRPNQLNIKHITITINNSYQTLTKTSLIDNDYEDDMGRKSITPATNNDK